MQKVVGSNPIIRFSKTLQNRRVCYLQSQLGKPHGHVEVWIVASADDASYSMTPLIATMNPARSRKRPQ
jgi:hypothetical protein